jgi:hypothetical protein
MGLLKQREERTAVIALRVPSSLKTQFQVLRKRAYDAGLDLSATILDALTRLAKQARDELDLMRRRGTRDQWPGDGLGNGKIAVSCVNISRRFALRAETESAAMGKRGGGASFVEQDKATAVRYGIFDAFSNELAAFSLGAGHDRATVRYGRKRSRIASSTPLFSVSGSPSHTFVPME